MMTEYGAYILEQVESIREKNTLIKNSKLDYKDFNQYSFMIKQIENFDINKNFSDSVIVKKLNDFIFKVDNLFEDIILRNKLREQAKENKDFQGFFNKNLDSDLCFLEALKQIKLFSQKKDYTKEELGFFIEELNELLLNTNFKANQVELLKQALELFKEEYLNIQENKDSSYAFSNEVNNEQKFARANKR